MLKQFRSFQRSLISVLLVVALAVLAVTAATAQSGTTAAKPNPLAEILAKKGVLTADELKQIESAPAQQADSVMARILLDKGVLSKAEYEQIAGAAPAAAPQTINVTVQATTAPAASGAQPTTMTVTATAVSAPAPATPAAPAVTVSTSTVAPSATVVKPATPAAPPVIAAITPLRLLPVGGVKSDSIVAAFKANGVSYAPYGFIRATLVRDSSDPGGDDFPLPGFLGDTGPEGSPEVHLKVRNTRMGLNLAWADPNQKLNLTGKIELDFEGNFNRSDNRNISTIRSSNPSIRLAWGRMDYMPNAKNTYSALFGQDWTPFTSSTLPNILEATGYGIAFGVLWERTQQFRVGYTHKFDKFQIMPEFAVTMPSAGLTPSAANVSMQLGYGERQGPDANRPGLEGRVVGQWQLDHTAGVAPAQIILSGENGSRKAVVLASAVPSAYQSTFAAGATVGSSTKGWTAEWQLPTRFFTLIGRFYSGSDLRFFFGGQLYSNYNDTAGLTSTASATSVDGASTVIFGTNSLGQKVVAPQRPVRAEGGWAQIGFPLSRIFGANPTGRNAGWTLYAMYGVDQAKTRDLNKIGGATRRYGTMAVGTLNYTVNKWLAFSFEQSLYTTHANPEQTLPIFRGVPARQWNDVRQEFGPTFTF